MNTNFISTDGYLWAVPINFSTSDNPNGVVKSFLLDTKSAEVTIDNVPEDG